MHEYVCELKSTRESYIYAIKWSTKSLAVHSYKGISAHGQISFQTEFENFVAL